LNQTLANTQSFIAEARKITWRDIDVADNGKLRVALLMKYGSLTKAAKALSVDYIALSHVVNGRRNPIEFVKLIQSDLALSDEQVLKLWPLLKTWPRKSHGVN